MATDSTTTSSSLRTTTPDPFLLSLQATALKELQKFNGDPTQKVTHFINAIEQIGGFTSLTDSMLHSIATLNAIETSGLAHLHPLMPHLLTLLQQVHSSNSTQSPPSSLPYPSSSQLSTTPVPTWPNLTYPTTSSSSVPALKF